jgi:hypothetical protein
VEAGMMIAGKGSNASSENANFLIARSHFFTLEALVIKRLPGIKV